MKNNLLVFALGLLLLISPGFAQNDHNYQAGMHQALDLILHNHAYLSEQKIDWSCIESTYLEQAKLAQNDREILKVFERLMLEFTDNHMILNTNNNDSYRLYGPIKLIQQDTNFVVDDIWQSNLKDAVKIQTGDQFIALNGQSAEQVIDDFPIHCTDKSRSEVRQWIMNKALAGIYSKPRLLRLKNHNTTYDVDLDTLAIKTSHSLLDFTVRENLAIITINDSLGNTNLIQVFDEALNQLSKTEGLILDLRNTISGGDSYMARAIMGRLIDEAQAYQKHQYLEQRGGAIGVNRIWLEYVEPREPLYDKPLVILSNYWTGSMGEGLTIGLQGMKRATWVGSEMAGLLGAVNQFKINDLGFSIQMPVEQLFGTDNTPRNQTKPNVVIKPNLNQQDNVLRHAINYLKQKVKSSKEL